VTFPVPARMQGRAAFLPWRPAHRHGSVGVEVTMAIDSYRFLDFATRQILKAWVAREAHATRPIPWAPMSKPLDRCTVALVTTAGVARRDDEPFDQERERRDPWWGDPTYRLLPQGVTESEVGLHHMHIDTRFGEKDLDVVLPARRLAELASEGVVGRAADTHYSIMGYQLRPDVLENETAPAIAREMRARGVDAAALVPA
jgi:D-proline reductase (dithiol) PrdB